MIEDDYAFRFGGIERLYGRLALQAFRQSHIAIIGLGGVGSWAAEAMARSGIGHITLIDMDDVCVSNTNRQLHALEGQYGRTKTDAMADRLRAINPHADIRVHFGFVTPKNTADVIHPDMDGVIDAIDSVKAKAALIAHCQRRKIPLVVAGGAGGQMDPTQIQVADLSRTTQDPLLAKVRNMLRREYGFSRNPKRRFGIEAVYSLEQLTYPAGDGEVCLQKPATDGPVRLDCASGFGAASPVTATFGFVATSRLLNRIATRARKAATPDGSTQRT
ncbi:MULTISPECIES: tRNA cyclic N6-threonylcarbamoyladenosine(37) synthase TcdA [Marinobacter]|uniref:tRNA threonylcarbamoyladenosine dehydratase n=1 Tax=Marinobacter profundi TaxID=2666256 RepID=A0A2G1UJH1_9GAMM|nr:MULTISPECIES: tRNA cyclic N6-threonylcarbamoyladenosine(37) synthase TcdA [Marinobacter]MBD3656566.1 tRNA cyclic N6-threonylcarbamoyladenosine(37) synthase TcdA [Marinobacter sp.]PHQ14633.1 tRNA cyclic N6-threonylcarbamoyladenosine(37) synthase TcdA [Marinobacter profundi]